MGRMLKNISFIMRRIVPKKGGFVNYYFPIITANLLLKSPSADVAPYNNDKSAISSSYFILRLYLLCCYVYINKLTQKSASYKYLKKIYHLHFLQQCYNIARSYRLSGKILIIYLFFVNIGVK